MSVESLLCKRKEEEGEKRMSISFLQIINPINFLFLPGEKSEKIEERKCITFLVLPPCGRQPVMKCPLLFYLLTTFFNLFVFLNWA